MTARRLPVLVLLAAGLVCSFLGVRLLVADIFAWQASRFVADWSQRGEVASDRAWLVAETAARRAIGVTPVATAIHYERLGRIYEWRDLNLPLGNPDAEQSRVAARDAYRRTLELRPLWPYTWARLAYVKLRLLQIDDEFDEALRQAVALGPWRVNVNKTVAEIGLIAWLELDGSQRTLVLEATERTLVLNRRAGQQVMALAARFHRVDDVCAALDREVAEARKVCQ